LLREAGEAQTREAVVHNGLARLTPREREVLQALASGLSDKEIAARLGFSRDTAHTHVVKILAKLEVDSRLQAVILAASHGAVTLGDAPAAVAT
jgi:DNA-binding NarL/FixJ family response regulator